MSNDKLEEYVNMIRNIKDPNRDCLHKWEDTTITLDSGEVKVTGAHCIRCKKTYFIGGQA